MPSLTDPISLMYPVYSSLCQQFVVHLSLPATQRLAPKLFFLQVKTIPVLFFKSWAMSIVLKYIIYMGNSNWFILFPKLTGD